MWLPLTAIAVGAPLMLAVADNVPTLNVEPSCRAVADSTSAIRRDFGSCMDAERKARADIEKQWAEFKPAAKQHCVALSTTGGVPSYTELLTCLEMERAAAQLPRRPEPSTTGSGAGGMMPPAHRQPMP